MQISMKSNVNLGQSGIMLGVFLFNKNGNAMMSVWFWPPQSSHCLTDTSVCVIWGWVTKGIIAFRFIGSWSCDDQWFEHPEILSENFFFVAFIIINVSIVDFLQSAYFLWQFLTMCGCGERLVFLLILPQFPLQYQRIVQCRNKTKCFLFKKKKKK